MHSRRFTAFAAEPDYAGKIAPDEAGFMDRSRTMFFFTEAEDVKWGGVEEHARARVKLLALLRRRRDLMPDAFHAHWSGPHAAIFERTPALEVTPTKSSKATLTAPGSALGSTHASTHAATHAATSGAVTATAASTTAAASVPASSLGLFWCK